MFRELHLLSVAYLWRVHHYSRSALGLETHRRDLCMIIHRIPIQAYGNVFLWVFNPSWHLTRLVGPRAWLLSGHSWIQWRPFHIEALCLWVSFVFLMHKFPQNPFWHLQCQTHAHKHKKSQFCWTAAAVGLVEQFSREQKWLDVFEILLSTYSFTCTSWDAICIDVVWLWGPR